MLSFAKTAFAVLASAGILAAGAPQASAATYYNIVNDKSGKCISVAGGSTANGAEILQWTCSDASERLWYKVGDQLKNRKSGKCLAVSGGGSTANGAKLVLWSCNGAFDQMWTRLSDGVLANHKSGKVAAVAGGGSTANGAKIVIWTANGGADQYWTFKARVIDA